MKALMIAKKGIGVIGKAFKRENMPYTMSVIMLLLVWLLLDARGRVRELKDQMAARESMINNNISAMNDTIRVIRGEQGKLIYMHGAYLSELEELKKYDEDLYNEISDLKSDVISYIDSKLNIVAPRLHIPNTLYKYDDSLTYGLLFDKRHKETGLSMRLKGRSTFSLENNTVIPGQTFFDSTRIEVGLKYGFVESDDKYEVFAFSPSKAVTFTDLNGALILDKNFIRPSAEKPPRLHWSVNAGYYYFPAANKFSWGFGLGLGYRLWDWPLSKPK